MKSVLFSTVALGTYCVHPIYGELRRSKDQELTLIGGGRMRVNAVVIRGCMAGQAVWIDPQIEVSFAKGDYIETVDGTNPFGAVLNIEITSRGVVYLSGPFALYLFLTSTGAFSPRA